MNEKKCNGYESMYTFLNEEDFLKHLDVCEDCRKEHEKMQKISALIQEAKPYIVRKKKDRLKQLKVACVALGVFGVGLTYPMYTIGTDVYEKAIVQTQYDALTSEDSGFAVDEYGFLYIN